MTNYVQDRARGSAAPDESLERDAVALFAVMTDLLRVYQFRDRDRMGYHGLTITQSYVMEAVIRRGQLTLNDLAAEMNLDKSTLSRVVDGLVRKGAVQRIANPADARSTLIEATRSGKQRRSRIEADIAAENAKVLSGFSPTVRRQLITLIERLTRAARDRHLARIAEDGD
jgi:MarR family 2-MHQ and catechol resistance regulon transcriptional repressor